MSVGATWVVVDLSGFGVRALCTPATAASVRIGEPATLHDLPGGPGGLADPLRIRRRRRAGRFELVQSASGIGPKIAQAVVAVLAPDDLRAAIAPENIAALTRCPASGVKGAQRW